ncbi:MAG: hypothetical protein HYX68_27030 [Planctomycetes bacterium]|nr:hypothetical protein [Planctomycetota bacterium]
MAATRAYQTQLALPDEILFCQWAIAAGLAGHSLQLRFQGFPAPILRRLFQVCTSWTSADRVHAVYGLADFRTLTQGIVKPRLILVFDARLAVKIAWRVALHQRDDSEWHDSCPAVFVCQSPRLGDEDPAATLVLHGHPAKVGLLTDWLRHCSDANIGKLPRELLAPIDFDGRLENLLWPAGPETPKGLRRYRECQILRGLLVGARILRERSTPATAAPKLTVTLGDYSAVYGRLQSASLQPEDAHFDPLAEAMVNRANAQLAMRHQKNAEPAKVARLEGKAAAANSVSSRDRLITRREIWNLGNPNGSSLKQLVKYLLAVGEQGYKTFRTLGTIQPLPRIGSWPEQEPARLVKLLIPWSDKQVRDHFHRLYVEGLIEALPRPGNQPWVYVLPEVVRDPTSPFLHLPAPASVAGLPEATAPATPGMTIAGPQEWAGGNCEPPDINDENKAD